LHVFDEQQIILSSNPKSTDFRLTKITQEQEFRPCCRAEPQHRS
jgi:hypothetical protein